MVGRGPARDLERRSVALALRLEGLTFAEIGAKLDLSRQRIQQMLSPPKAVRDFVVERAMGKCQRCGVLVGKAGHVHHRKSSEVDAGAYNDQGNLRLLCPSCHRSEHKTPSGQLTWDQYVKRYGPRRQARLEQRANNAAEQ